MTMNAVRARIGLNVIYCDQYRTLEANKIHACNVLYALLIYPHGQTSADMTHTGIVSALEAYASDNHQVLVLEPYASY